LSHQHFGQYRGCWWWNAEWLLPCLWWKALSVQCPVLIY